MIKIVKDNKKTKRINCWLISNAKKYNNTTIGNEIIAKTLSNKNEKNMANFPNVLTIKIRESNLNSIIFKK